ncbi:MAG: LacI family transcriptional regulator [Candidatus Omnitrophica bacterium]|nr:LacI family transcriptional regulator [Candidatus Omnitrophota bacterium]
MGNFPKTLTLSELARQAGVSKTVVSVVVNRKENRNIRVSEKKRQEILRLIERYRFVPTKSARELASRRTNTIAIIFHQLTPYFSFLVEQLQKKAFEKNMEIMPYITEGRGDREEEYLSLMRDRRVDGIIIAAITEGSVARYVKFSSPPYNLKIVVINEPIGKIPSVHFDEMSAGRLAAQHLVEIGCRSLCCFGPAQESGRTRGFLKYACEQGITDLKTIPAENNSSGTFSEGRKLAEKLLSLKKPPDGVFANNDLYAAALLQKVLEHGYRVPKDMAIVGCDNTEVCLYAKPTLTSIDTNAPLAAETALAKLLDVITGKPVRPLHTKIPVRLVVRESTTGRLSPAEEE